MKYSGIGSFCFRDGDGRKNETTLFSIETTFPRWWPHERTLGNVLDLFVTIILFVPHSVFNLKAAMGFYLCHGAGATS